MEQVENIYANAIFELAVEENKLDDFNQDLNSLYDLFKSEKKFASVLVVPVVSSVDKKEIVDNLFKGKISDDILNLIKMLIDNERISYFSGICESFFKLYRQEKNIALAKVYTIEPLDDEERTKLIDKLSKMTGKTIEMEEFIDESLIGGIKIRIGNRILDSSALSQLKKLEETLIEIDM